ncbi:MAG: GatB/YqeY domain-containing protein [Candidatus Komeilibacteria bacterium]|nr:GatB/YqeY domain-containing protein [Candidatus Komeilibacteria bacterium]
MNLVEKIEKDKLTAMKERQALRLSVLRMLSTALKNATISKMEILTDDEALKIIRTEIKKRQDSIAAFDKAGMADKVKQESQEKEILEQYLPPPMTDEELEVIVKDTLATGNFTQMSQFGQAMGATVKAVGGRADGQRVQTVVKKHLGA